MLHNKSTVTKYSHISTTEGAAAKGHILLRRVHTNAVLETRFNVDSPNAYSIRIGLFTLQVTTTKIYIVKTNGGHGVQVCGKLV